MFLGQLGLFSPERGLETGLVPAPAAPLALPVMGLPAVGLPAPYPCACLLGRAASPFPSVRGPFLLGPDTWGIASLSYCRAFAGCRKLCAVPGHTEKEGDPVTLLGKAPSPAHGDVGAGLPCPWPTPPPALLPAIGRRERKGGTTI